MTSATAGLGEVATYLDTELTTEERNMIARRRERQQEVSRKKAHQAALTGEGANYPSLSTVWSNDLVTNIMRSTQSRLLTFQWKKMVWQLRVRAAVAEESRGRAQWKRNPRWLDMLIGKEIAALWGHFGSMRQKLQPPIKTKSPGSAYSSRGA